MIDNVSSDTSLQAMAENAVATMPSNAAGSEPSEVFSALRVPVSALNTKHAEWTAYQDTWNELAILYRGKRAELKQNAEKLLWQRPKEPKDIFTARCAALTYTNILGSGLTWYQTKIFGEDVQIDLKKNGEALTAPAPGSTEKPDPDFDYYHRFQSDCNRNGKSLSDLYRDIYCDMLVFGKCYVLLDLPTNVQYASSLADQVIEPYLSTFDPRNVYNWQEDEYGALEWIVFGTETIEQRFLKSPVKICRWYYYDKQNFAVFERRSDEKEIQGDPGPMARLVQNGPHSMADYKNADGTTGRVPVVVHQLPEAMWLAGRVDLQVRDHLNTENALRWGLFLACLAIPVVKTDGEFNPQIAEHALIQLNKGDEFGWAEPSGKSFELSAARLDNLREEIYRMMYLQAQGKSSAATASAQSGYSKEQDMAASVDVVNAFGKILRTLIQYTLRLVAGIRRDNVVADVRGLSFDDDPALNDLIAAQQVAGLGIQSDTFAKELQKNIVRIYGRDWNDDLLGTIFQEIQDAPTKSELEAQQQQMEQQQLESKLSSAASTLVTSTQRQDAKAA